MAKNCHISTPPDALVVPPPCQKDDHFGGFCREHWSLMLKKKRSAAAAIEAHLLGTPFGWGVWMWTDTCKRRCKCQVCGEPVKAGESRIVLHGQSAAKRPLSGGYFNYHRYFAHLECFWNSMGTGCIHCVDSQSVKIRSDLAALIADLTQSADDEAAATHQSSLSRDPTQE